MKDMEKENNNIELGNIKLTNVSPTDNAAVINHNTTTTTVDSNVIDIKHNMMNMVNIMNSMVGKLDTDGN